MAKIKYQPKTTETRLDYEGKHHLVQDASEYLDRVEESTIKGFRQNETPKYTDEQLKKFRDKPAFQYTDEQIPPEWQEKIKNSILAFTVYLQDLERKLRDRVFRQETVQRLKEAKTKEEKRQILEEFHKEPFVERKQTALKLDCMKEIREIRRRSIMANMSRPAGSAGAGKSSSETDEKKRLDWRRAEQAKRGSER